MLHPPIKRTITKRFTFCYGHHLPNYKGKCANQHGHNANVEVEVAGDSGEYPGMIMDFGTLKRIVNEVLEILDHQNLNEVEEPKEPGVKIFNIAIPPTAENISSFIAYELGKRLPKGIYLVRVSVSETDTSWAHWRNI